jgi:hypothetical protein
MRFNFSRMTEMAQGFGSRGITPTHKTSDEIDVYRDHDKPHSSYMQIGLLTNDGRVFERDEIEAAFIKTAREMGGDALVLQEPVKSIEAPRGWDLYDTFVFEAVVVSYQ